MSFAALNIATGLIGYFTEKDHGRPFEYKNNPETVLHPNLKTGRNTVYPHMIFVGPQGDQVRMAFVKKTVAYVVVNENDNGFVIEKWNIKNHRSYKR
jgi:hypothetical protein